MTIEKGEWIKVEYTGTFDDGSVFDSTEMNGGIPLHFQVGAQMLIKGFDDSVVGKAKGDEYEIKLNPNEAYGEYRDGLTQTIPRNQFPPEVEPQSGMMLMLMGPGNQPIPASIKEVDDEFVTIDLNHPMAGKVLNFNIKIVETNCEAAPPSACGCGCDHDHMDEDCGGCC